MKFILYFLLITPLLSLSQKKEDVHLMTVNYPDFTVKAEVLQKFKPFTPEEKNIYSWYKSNKILETEGGYDGKLLHGSYTSFYLNNNLKEKGVFKKGLKVGKWMKWYSNGKLMEISYWKDGLKNGKNVQFDQKGNKITEAEYKKGKLHGNLITYIAGKAVSKKKYRCNIEIPKKEKKPQVVKVKQTSKDLKKPGFKENFIEKRDLRREERNKEKNAREKSSSGKERSLFKKKSKKNIKENTNDKKSQTKKK